jgi:hypothetical protein
VSDNTLQETTEKVFESPEGTVDELTLELTSYFQRIKYGVAEINDYEEPYYILMRQLAYRCPQLFKTFELMELCGGQCNISFRNNSYHPDYSCTTEPVSEGWRFVHQFGSNNNESRKVEQLQQNLKTGNTSSVSYRVGNSTSGSLYEADVTVSDINSPTSRDVTDKFINGLEISTALPDINIEFVPDAIRLEDYFEMGLGNEEAFYQLYAAMIRNMAILGRNNDELIESIKRFRENGCGNLTMVFTTPNSNGYVAFEITSLSCPKDNVNMHVDVTVKKGEDSKSVGLTLAVDNTKVALRYRVQNNLSLEENASLRNPPFIDDLREALKLAQGHELKAFQFSE